MHAILIAPDKKTSNFVDQKNAINSRREGSRRLEAGAAGQGESPREVVGMVVEEKRMYSEFALRV